MLNFDFFILDFIREHFTNELCDKIMVVISSLGNAGMIWLVFTLIMLCMKKYRKIGIIMAIALVSNLILCNIILKPLIARPRPFVLRPWVDIIINLPGDFSFPSGHTAASFAVASALFFARNKMWYPSAVLAALIAYTRLYLYVHYPTDILGGIVIGIISGFFANMIYDKIYNKGERGNK